MSTDDRDPAPPSDARPSAGHPRLDEIDPEAGRRARVRRRLLQLVLAVALLSGSISALFGDRGLAERVRLHAECRRLSAQIEAAEARVAELESAIEDLDADPYARERIARERLGYARPGEVVFLW